MSMPDLYSAVESFIVKSGLNAELRDLTLTNALRIIKYIPAERLEDTLKQQHLYASERAGFTWGDALYVTPAKFPKTTMMYGDVGVVGSWRIDDKRFFNAADPQGVDLYQKWILTRVADYNELTTTVHANEANRRLRNDFRTRFQIDCVYFRPDETCTDYVDEKLDWWLAITHWDSSRSVGHGFSKAAYNLRWCVTCPDSFKQAALGYTAILHSGLSGSHKFIAGHYTTLEADIAKVYATPDTVLICDFK